DQGHEEIPTDPLAKEAEIARILSHVDSDKLRKMFESLDLPARGAAIGQSSRATPVFHSPYQAPPFQARAPTEAGARSPAPLMPYPVPLHHSGGMPGSAPPSISSVGYPPFPLAMIKDELQSYVREVVSESIVTPKT